MSGDTDFLTLYQELGLAPGVSSLDEFKQAYRRRVVQLHPDRRVNTPDAADEARLQRLTQLYGAAIAFEQRYGRLPGAEPVSRRGYHQASAGGAGGAPPRTGSGPAAEETGAAGDGVEPERRQQARRVPETAARSNRGRYILALVILLALAWAVWGVGVATH
jgi:DnaJ-class molecular chaperone